MAAPKTGKSVTKPASKSASSASSDTAAKKLPKKLMSLVKKRAAKSAAVQLRQSSKTQVRLTRSSLRAEKAAEKAPKAKSKTKNNLGAERSPTKGQAPHSARISAVRGPIQPEASRTQFVPRFDGGRRWLVVDAKEQTVGRLASEIAMLLRGKHKTTFTPNNDAGDFVVVINAELVKFTAQKETDKRYQWHTGYIGGLKQATPARLRQKHPELIIENAVKGMIARTPLGRAQMRKLKIYTGTQHPHAAQGPVVWELRHSVRR